MSDVVVNADLVVVGGGAAGLFAALSAADEGAEVVVLTKGPLFSSNSYVAQGGIAAALGADDSPALHARDTLSAGRGLCREDAVSLLAADAPARIADLERLGVAFDSGLAREGGHSRRRIVHAGGAETGRKVTEALARRVLEQPAIAVREGERAQALLLSDGRCVGVRSDGCRLVGRATLLACGGYAALFERTTNPPGSVGDALVLAYHAGAALADLELVQFHPTALLDTGFMLTEALRGDGALLLDESGARFTDELAPRDVVARAIAARTRAGLDLRPIDRSRYPGLIATIENAGYDPARVPVPVAPAAHYAIGGVVTDLEGRSTIPGLYAAGECAATGVHGANRLASNSLLECLVFGRRAALAALSEPPATRAAARAAGAAEPHPSAASRRSLWRSAGLTRNATGLTRLLGSKNLLVRLLAASALARAESRGVHFRSDFPAEDPVLAGVHVVVSAETEPRLERWGQPLAAAVGNR